MEVEIARKLEDQCILIESYKVTSRKQGCDGLVDLLHCKSTIDFLNVKGQEWWTKILHSIQSSLLKDAEKKADDSKKKGQNASNTAPKSADVFVTFMKAACKENAPLNYRKIFNFIMGSLTNTTMKCLEPILLDTISYSFLRNAYIRSQLRSQDWETLYSLLKLLFEKHSTPNTEGINCFSLIIKWGPLYNFPVNVFRQGFGVVTRLCQTVSSSSPRPQQKAVLELVHEFIQHAAKDNRMACCKLAEEVFANLMELYEHNTNEDKMKANLVDFFYLLLAIHNPKGVKQHHPAAYAVSWTTWRGCLCSIYYMLIREIELGLGLTIKNQSFFILKNDTMRLCDSFVFLFVEVCRQLFDNNDCDFVNMETDSDDRPAKRQKTNFSIDDLIEKIKCTASWSWLNLTYHLIEEYPDVMKEEHYLIFLRILNGFQDKYKDITLLYHVYRALLVMDKVEHAVQKSSLRSDIEKLWKSVAEAVLRSLAVTQYEEEVQTLIQRLIVKKIIKSPDALFQNYRPGGVLNLTRNNLRTLDVAFQTFTYLQFDSKLKVEIMQWILKNAKGFCHGYMAEILVYLILKQWPNDRPQNIVQPTKPFEDIEDIYLNTTFENLLCCPPESQITVCNNIFCYDQTLLSTLVDSFTRMRHSEDVTDNVEVLLNVTVLIFNVASYLVNYEVITDDSTLCELFQICSRILFTKLDLTFNKHVKGSLEIITSFVSTLNLWFSTHICEVISQKLRQLVPEDLIRALFLGLNTEVTDGVQERQLVIYKKQIIQALTSFCCLPDSGNTLEIQGRALQVLLTQDYDCSTDQDYELVVTLLHSIKLCETKFLDEDNLVSVFNLFQNICEARYHCAISAVKILALFCEIYPLVSASRSEICQTHFIEILHLFYSKRLDYGPEVSIKLLQCMGLIYELEPECIHSRWSNEEIILKLPEFLTSDYQGVRFTAIQIIMKFYVVSSGTRLLKQFHRQEIMFSNISIKSLQVLQIEGNVSEERLIDETVTRSASILHTYASLMTSSHLWIEEALFALLKTACDKNLSQLKIVLEMVAKKLHFENAQSFVEKYLVTLFNRWKQHDIEQFPFHVFNCSSKAVFYSKYWDVLAPILVENDKNNLNIVGTTLNKPLHELLEVTFSKLLSYCIAQEEVDLKRVKINPIYKLLCDTVGVNKVKDLFDKKVDEIFLHLVEFVNDHLNFKQNFGENIIFPKFEDINLSVERFQNCVKFIENTLCEGSVLMSYIMQKTPKKIHYILLNLSIKIEGARTLEEKLRYFHIYSLVCTMCLDSVMDEPAMQPYLVRNLTHTLLHLIKSHKAHLELSRISCKFFKTFLQKLLPRLAKTLKEFLLIIVSRLKYIALENCPVSDLCVDMLHLLIVEHKDFFIDEIQKLDSIPHTTKFQTIYSVHYGIKYNHRNVTLEDEIKQFLDFGKNIESFDECEYSLGHLRNLLVVRKDELKRLYDGLRSTRGFSEDCENSCLHQLICMLMTLTCSSNDKVSSEAVRCLGEIGPADLASLILQPEKPIADAKWTPWELTVGYAISLLAKYVVDSQVEVVKVAGEALFNVLSTKEGRKVAESGIDLGFGRINSDYLVPFLATLRCKNTFSLNVEGDLVTTTVSKDDLWIPQHCCHNTWITRLVCTILETFKETKMFSSFIEVCKLKVEFCEQLLPLIIYTILYSNDFVLTKIISAQIEIFFDRHWEITVQNTNPSEKSITTNKSSLQCMLNIVHFIRLQQNVRTKQIKDINLDYLKVAKAAHFCTAHFTALLYAELWCRNQVGLDPQEYNFSTCTYTNLDLIYEKVDEITANALYNILRQAYKAVGEIDALLGCGTSHLLNRQNQIEHHKELGRWEEVTHWYEIEVSLGQKASLPPLMESLKNSNLYQLPLFCSNALEEPQYESLWRLGQWNYNKSNKDNESNDSCDKYKFFALKALHDNDKFSFEKSLDGVRSCIVQKLVGVNLESSKNFYNILTQMQCFKEIEDFAESVRDNKMTELLVKWKVQDEIIQNDFQFVEPIKAQRMVLLKEFLKLHCQREDLKDTIVETMLEFSQFARMVSKAKIASRILGDLRLLPHLSNDVHAKIKLEEAELYWTIPDVVVAKCILRELCTSENVNPRLHAVALKTTGKWMVESSSESRETIIENYFKKSLLLVQQIRQKTIEDQKSVMDTYDQLAKFADREYQQVMSHIKSDAFQKKKENMVKTQQSISNINIGTATKDLRKAVAIKQRQNYIDQTEIDNIETEKNDLLQLALKYYLLNLIKSDDHNITIFRLISLLLENRNTDVIRSVLETDLIKIPTYKYINILPQITPHISSTSGDLFGYTVCTVIEKCAREHPYHTLPLILSLAMSNKDRDYAESKAVVNDQRMHTANVLLKKLKDNTKMAALIQKMAFLSEAVIELAYYKSDGDVTRSLKVPKRCKIRKIQGYDDVLLPTYTLSVDKTSAYSRIVGISGFSETYNNVGGINAPKRIACRGTDGIDRTQLVKGQDDLRQDAVMQQVFTIMNSLLALDKQTKHLLIRTYKVVPLSMRSGILEWVENTMLFGEYLTGDDGAHAKYRPMDKLPHRCRADYKNLNSKLLSEKVRLFKNICNNIKPVFHKFFEDTFPQPTVWYERRRAYIHSVATSSMCGYILGIGDRHVSNILIDKSTAEIVHIDFGIAFEQGRVLPTPETVPFRLTRDIVDGMGVSGVEGVFRRSCEKTMEVFRTHHQTIITILEVLLYDPLYDWTVSTAEANKRQNDDSDSEIKNINVCGNEDDSSQDVNVTAERALLRLKAKLQGTEFGYGKLTTVERQVGTLIQQAVDPSNLCRLFHGWQPYL